MSQTSDADQKHELTMRAHALLLTIRMVWFAMLMGQLVFLVVIWVLWNNGFASDMPADVVNALFYATLGMFVAITPAAYFIRMQTYKKNWQAQAVTPSGYFTGNLLFFAMFEGVSLFALVVTLLHGSLWPTVLPSVLAMAIQAVNFPNGNAMRTS